MPVQGATDYSAKHAVAVEGQRANLGLTNITSKVAEDSDIAFGRAVVRGTADNQAKLPGASGQSFLGVTEMTSAWAANASDVHLYAENREMNIIDFGEIWVYTEQSVVPGDSVFFRHTADTAPLDVVGRFRKDLSGGDADQIIGASFETTTAAGGLAKIKINNPGLGVLISPDSSETITATSGAISILTGISYFDTTAGVSTATLADGVDGQKKTLAMLVDGGNQVVTPANLLVGTTLTFADAGDSITLLFDGTNWGVISNNGVVAA